MKKRLTALITAGFMLASDIQALPAAAQVAAAPILTETEKKSDVDVNNGLDAYATRVTITDANTGDLVPDDVLSEINWHFSARITMGEMKTAPMFSVTENQSVIDTNDLAKNYLVSDSFILEGVGGEVGECKTNNNGSLEIYFVIDVSKYQPGYDPNALPATATRITLYDTDTGALIPDCFMEKNGWGFDAFFETGEEYTKDFYRVKKNPYIIDSKEFTDAVNNSEFVNITDKFENSGFIINYDNGSVDVVFNVKIKDMIPDDLPVDATRFTLWDYNSQSFISSDVLADNPWRCIADIQIGDAFADPVFVIDSNPCLSGEYQLAQSYRTADKFSMHGITSKANVKYVTHKNGSLDVLFYIDTTNIPKKIPEELPAYHTLVKIYDAATGELVPQETVFKYDWSFAPDVETTELTKGFTAINANPFYYDNEDIGKLYEKKGGFGFTGDFDFESYDVKANDNGSLEVSFVVDMTKATLPASATRVTLINEKTQKPLTAQEMAILGDWSFYTDIRFGDKATGPAYYVIENPMILDDSHLANLAAGADSFGAYGPNGESAEYTFNTNGSLDLIFYIDMSKYDGSDKLPQFATRVTIFDKLTGELVPDDYLKDHPFKFTADTDEKDVPVITVDTNRSIVSPADMFDILDASGYNTIFIKGVENGERPIMLSYENDSADVFFYINYTKLYTKVSFVDEKGKAVEIPENSTFTKDSKLYPFTPDNYTVSENPAIVPMKEKFDINGSYTLDINSTAGYYEVTKCELKNDDSIVCKVKWVSSGDANGDGELSIADAVVLQKWLLGSADASFADWKSMDFCRDNVIDVFDMILMKQKLVEHKFSTFVDTYRESSSSILMVTLFPDLPLRYGPGEEYDVITTLPEGASAYYMGCSSDESWYVVYYTITEKGYPETYIGWIKATKDDQEAIVSYYDYIG